MKHLPFRSAAMAGLVLLKANVLSLSDISLRLEELLCA
ncbi:hypothetical protein CECT5772_07914 [Streptococcus equi subsp. ruminatorum CECT 5772]|uniref:Uncharacterized protein n=1 Tax=Streptococcus equi subsp. ruminatorum CECT 5772 TaxID=1051981 RepID=A0A922NTL7_9STRE|nr:hypothetical protein CECT5772_07914 [Streptococcus equi subsp. ruminatorum CECT 5772]